MYKKVCWYIVQRFFKDKKMDMYLQHISVISCHPFWYTNICVTLRMDSVSASLMPERVDEIVQLLSSNCLILSLAFQLSLFNRNLSLSLSLFIISLSVHFHRVRFRIQAGKRSPPFYRPRLSFLFHFRNFKFPLFDISQQDLSCINLDENLLDIKSIFPLYHSVWLD